MCKNYIYFYGHFPHELFQLFLLHQYFQYILQLVYQIIFSYIYNLNNLNTHQYHKDLSHSYSHLLGFQINPLSHTLLSINSLHSHLHLSSFQCCLLLQTLASSLYLYLHVSCRFICLASLILDIRLKTLIFKCLIASGTHNCV